MGTESEVSECEEDIVGENVIFANSLVSPFINPNPNSYMVKIYCHLDGS